MEKRKIRVEIVSRICNLLFEGMIQDKLKDRIKADQARTAFKLWIDGLQGKSAAFRSGSDRAIADADGDVEDFLSGVTALFPDATETIEASSAGEIAVTENGGIEITYDESGYLGMGCKTVISFGSDDPKRVIVHRTGTADASLTFDGTTPRVLCMYQTEAGALSIAVLTHRIMNNAAELLRGADSAEIVIDYTLEMGGAKTEYCHYQMKLTAEDDR